MKPIWCRWGASFGRRSKRPSRPRTLSRRCWRFASHAEDSTRPNVRPPRRFFVHESNPLSRITLPQLAAILGRPQTITRWGQLGPAGEWADRPVTIYMPPRMAPNAMSMQMMVLKGGAWSDAAHEDSIVETATAIARDPGAIGFGGFEESGPQLKALAIAAN